MIDTFTSVLIYFVIGLIITYYRVHVWEPKTEEKRQAQTQVILKIQELHNIHPIIPFIGIFIISWIALPTLVCRFLGIKLFKDNK